MNEGDANLTIALQTAEANHQIELARYVANSQRSIEAGKAGNQAGSDAIKAITFLNGGAAVAILAFIGHLASSGVEQTIVKSLSRPLAFFVAGTFLAVCAAGVGYFAQSCNVFALNHEFRKLSPKADTATQKKEEGKEKRWRAAFPFFNWVAIICSAVALVFFAVACCQAYDAFSNIGRTKEKAMLSKAL